MVETRAPGTEQISHRILTRTKTRKIAFFEGCPVGWGEACDFCQCSHMSNTPMHDVHMLKVLVWTQ